MGVGAHTDQAQRLEGGGSCALAAMRQSIKQLGALRSRIAPRRRSHPTRQSISMGVGAAPSQRWGGRSSSQGCSAVAGKKVPAWSWQRWSSRLCQRRRSGSGCLFSGKALAKHAVGAQHLNSRQRAGLEAHEAAGVGEGRIPADRKMAAMETVGSAIGRRLFFGHGNPSDIQVGTASCRDYCSSLSTVCVCWLAWASTAVAAC